MAYLNQNKEAKPLCEWKEAVQRMIDWLEENLTEQPTLLELSRQVGYSPYYCSTQFHRIVGRTLKNYIAGRRLARAALEIRDTRERILDVAIKYGYSSQEALTRAFTEAFGCTPAAYRRNLKPLKLSIKLVVLEPYDVRKGDDEMSKTCLKEAAVRIEYVPAHKYIGIWENRAADYCSFWKYHSCDDVCGVIDSMSNVSDPIIGPHVPGWYSTKEGRKYFYGFGVPMDYNGPVPEGFELREFPGSYYAVFFHPAFDYQEDNMEVMTRVEELAWNYDVRKLGSPVQQYTWNEEVCQDYQRHYPEERGYEVYRPIRRV